MHLDPTDCMLALVRSQVIACIFGLTAWMLALPHSQPRSATAIAISESLTLASIHREY